MIASAEVDLVGAATSILGLMILSGIVAAVAGFVYRWYARDRIPEGLAALAGLGALAISLQTALTLQNFVVGTTPVSLSELGFPAIRNTVAFLGGTISAVGGSHLGDQLATDTTAIARKDVEGDVGRLVRAVGRVITVTLPDDIEDMEGYDPVAPETREDLTGTTFVFPRGLTVAELRDRVAERLKDDYGVGHVDLDLTVDGEVAYLALGSRAAGLGPTLAPGTAAVAVRADPPAGASPGDTVQVWRAGTADADPERLLTAELRAAAGDVVTLAADEADARALDPAGEYRLLTLPRPVQPEREFASLLRTADETMGATVLADGSDLVGRSVGEIEGSVVAVRPVEGAVVALPSRDRVLDAGDTLYVVARPETLRRIEATAGDAIAADTTSL